MTEPSKPHLRIVSAIERAEPLAGPGAPAPPGDNDGQSSRTGDAPPVDETGEPGEIDRACAQKPRTDLGNAERFLLRFGKDFLWCPQIGWLAWDGRRWAREGAEGMAAKKVHDAIRLIPDEARAIKDTPLDVAVDWKRGEPVLLSAKLHSWALASQGAAHVRCVAQLAAPYLEIAPERLDADPMLINLANGSIEAARRGDGEDYILFREHRRGDLCSLMSPVAYDPAAVCPVYDAFLAEVQPQEETRRALHQYGGLALTGDASEQKLHFWWGKGRNGKSTLAEIWCLVAGDYAETLPIESFLDHGRPRRGGEATPDLALLPGKRMLRTSEPEKGAKLAEGLIKMMTGGEPIQVRNLNRDPFKCRPVFKAIISGNYKPEIAGTDDGIWARPMLVPWGVTIPREKRDLQLGDKLKAEMPGILNRLLDGLRDWLDHGLMWADEIKSATEAYRADSDPIGRFLSVCTAADTSGRIQMSLLCEVYNAWAQAAGERDYKVQGFGRMIGERLSVVKSSVKFVVGLRLIKTKADFVDDQGRTVAQLAPAGEEMLV